MPTHHQNKSIIEVVLLTPDCQSKIDYLLSQGVALFIDANQAISTVVNQILALVALPRWETRDDLKNQVLETWNTLTQLYDRGLLSNLNAPLSAVLTNPKGRAADLSVIIRLLHTIQHRDTQVMTPLRESKRYHTSLNCPNEHQGHSADENSGSPKKQRVGRRPEQN